MLDRRALIKLGLYGGSGALLHLTRLNSGAFPWALDEAKANDVVLSSPLAHVAPFTTKLPVPRTKKPVDFKRVLTWRPAPPILDPASAYYEIRMRPAPVQIFPPGNPATVIWGFDPINLGPTYLGPTLEANIGERVIVRVHNHLGPKITSIIHHHGAHVTSKYDGSALWSQQIQAGKFRDYVYVNDDDIAATHWYHDHDIDNTGHNVFMGLEGFFLLHDQVELDLNLPGHPSNDSRLPGELPFDLPLVFQDRAFDANFQLHYDPFQHNGFIGDTFLVNGAIQPSIRVANRKYRLRILNGSNARFYHLALFTNKGTPMPFHVIGSDGGLYHKAVQVDGGFEIGPAERVEVVVDFSGLTPGPGTQVFLNNCLAQTDGRKPDELVQHCRTVPQIPGPDGVGSLCRFDVQFSAKDPSTFMPRQTLRTDIPVYNPAESVRTRTWKFERGNGEWLINGLPFDPGPPPPAPEDPRIDTNPPVKVGTTEIWQLINGSGGWYHPVHIHRNQFKIVERTINGTPTALKPTQRGLKDVFALGAGEALSVITKYTGTEQVGNYVMHCHNVEHEDMAMMIVWDVVA